jgi:non-specific serine/threonine protein kinase
MRAEIELLEDELHAAIGPGGRIKRGASDAERLRVGITHRIRSGIAQIAKHHPALGAYLSASVSTGYRCAYRPTGPAERTEMAERV